MQIYARRAGGVAVASDYTPHWAKSGNNHAWSVVIGADGKGYSPISGVAAKVYRKTFSEQLTSLGAKLQKGEEAPRWLKKKYYKDVTDSYVKTTDVLLKVVPSDQRYAYLCVFNSGHWRAIQWGEIEQDSVIFRGMGRDIAYLPAFFRNDEIVPAGLPFILQKDGTKRQVAIAGKEVAVTTSQTTGRHVAYEDWTDESVALPLETGIKYELKAWTPDGWNNIATKIGDGNPMEFNSLSSNGFYWLVEVDGDHEERPFTIKDGIIVRW